MTLKYCRLKTSTGGQIHASIGQNRGANFTDMYVIDRERESLLPIPLKRHTHKRAPRDLYIYIYMRDCSAYTIKTVITPQLTSTNGGGTTPIEALDNESEYICVLNESIYHGGPPVIINICQDLRLWLGAGPPCRLIFRPRGKTTRPFNETFFCFLFITIVLFLLCGTPLMRWRSGR